MRAIVVRAIGGPEVLRLEDVAPPAPAAGEVLVETRAIGVNFADTERRRGVYAAPVLPWIPGREGAGVVVALGDGVDAAWMGARVAYFAPRASGAYAERVTVPASALFRFNDNVPFETMAALPLQGLTAHGVLRLAAIARDQVVVVLAAAGGVGQILVQLAQRAGARVIAIVSSAAKVAAVAALGVEVADVIAGYDAFDLAVRARTGGRGADVVLDSIGKATAAASLAALAPYGQLVYYGDASGLPPPIDVDALYGRSLRVGAFGLDIDRDGGASFASARDELIAALVGGHLRLTVTRTFPLADAAAAHVEMEARRTVGKIVLVP